MPKPRERRARKGKGYPYYKLARWDEVSMTWKDGKKTFASEGEALRAPKPAGKYRISIVTDAERCDLNVFRCDTDGTTRFPTVKDGVVRWQPINLG